MIAVAFEGVSKTYSLGGGRLLLGSFLAHPFRRRRESFQALKRVSFVIHAGESVALIGANGAGKSTLLGLVAGIGWPDEGRVQVRGRLATLLEPGAGFHQDLTGAENIELNASILGLSRRRTRALFRPIVDFSGIGEFIHEPLRTYSTGMIVRLAFSIAVHTEPDILLVDEVLAVGDRAFQAKCAGKLLEMREQGKTLLCVSHADSVLDRLCRRGLWLDHGELMMDGDISEVRQAYEGQVKLKEGDLNATRRG